MSIRRLSIVAFPESRLQCTARCLEYDLSATGRTIELAVDALTKMIRAHIDYDRRHDREPLSAFTSAPRPYWEAFRRGTRQWVVEEPSWFRNNTPTQIDVAVVPQHPAIRPSPRTTRIA